MAKEQVVKGKRVLIAVLSKLYQYGQLPKDVFFKIFDTKICPVRITLWVGTVGCCKTSDDKKSAKICL